MRGRRFRVGTFNLFNLILPDVPYYRGMVCTPESYERKLAWVAGQLAAMHAEVVGFQEVFHAAALEAAVRRTELDPDAVTVAAPGADGTLPRVGLATTLPVLALESIADFPPEACLEVEGAALPYTRFRRPVLHATLDLPDDRGPVEVFVVHLKSKRPEVPDDRDPHDPKERALGKVRAALMRGAEAAALRCLLVDRMRGQARPVVVLGDMNDTRHAITTEILTGSPPWRSMPREVKQEIWDVLLYDARDLQARTQPPEVHFTHIHNGRYEALDQIFLSQEFARQNPRRLASVTRVRVLNDHLVDDTLADHRQPFWQSDHGQVVCEIELRPDTGRARRPPP